MTTKLHLGITNDEHIVEGMLSDGNISDISVADEITEDVYNAYVVEDRGYDSDAHRRTLESNNNIPVIPGRKNRKVEIIYDKVIYKLRRKIEIYFGKLKENKRIATRYDKADISFLGFIAIAAIKIFLKINL